MIPRRPLRIVSPLETHPHNPRAGLRRIPGDRTVPNPHTFAVKEYTIYIGGRPVRRCVTAPGGFVEVES